MVLVCIHHSQSYNTPFAQVEFKMNTGFTSLESIKPCCAYYSRTTHTQSSITVRHSSLKWSELRKCAVKKMSQGLKQQRPSNLDSLESETLMAVPPHSMNTSRTWMFRLQNNSSMQFCIGDVYHWMPSLVISTISIKFSKQLINCSWIILLNITAAMNLVLSVISLFQSTGTCP